MSNSLVRQQDAQVAPARPAAAGIPQFPNLLEREINQSTISDYWLTVMKRKWVVVAFFLISTTLITIATFRITPLYEAKASLLVGHEISNPLGFKTDTTDSVQSDDSDYTVALDTEARVLQSDDLTWQVIRSLKLTDNPVFLRDVRAPRPPQTAGDLQQPGTRADIKYEDAVRDAFQRNLKVNKVPHTRLLEIQYRSPDPKLAADIANTLANTYIESNFRKKYESTMQASDWLSRQLSDLKLKVENSQEALVRYERENNIVGLDEKQNIVTAKLEQLNHDFTEAQADRIQKEAEYNLVKTGDASLVVRAEPNSLLQQLKQQEATLQVQLAQQRTQFGPSYPAVKQLENQLHQIDASIATEVNAMQQRVTNDYRQAAGREAMLKAALEQQKTDANELSEKAIQYSLLKRDADSNRQLYEGIQQRMKEASVAAGLRSNNITIEDYAPVPAKPVVPNVPLNIFLGAMFGLGGGVVLAFLVENLDNTVRTPEHVELSSRLPTLGIVPRIDSTLTSGHRAGGGKLLNIRNTVRHDRAGASVALAAVKQPKSGVAEAYRAVRTSVLLGRAGAAPKKILITSALPKEGKSTTSANIAAVLAQRGGRVIIIDADLRRPSLHHIFSVQNQTGLSNVLAGGTSFGEAIIHCDQVPNLDILTAGPLSPQPSELLSSTAMTDLLANCAVEYDHVVIDSPPLLSVTDAGILSAWVDAVVLVVRSGKTTKHQLKQSSILMRQLGAPVMGVLVNAVDMEGSDRYYYGYSRYYYYRPYTTE